MFSDAGSPLIWKRLWVVTPLTASESPNKNSSSNHVQLRSVRDYGVCSRHVYGGERYRYAYRTIHNLGWYFATCVAVCFRLVPAQTLPEAAGDVINRPVIRSVVALTASAISGAWSLIRASNLCMAASCSSVTVLPLTSDRSSRESAMTPLAHSLADHRAEQNFDNRKRAGSSTARRPGIEIHGCALRGMRRRPCNGRCRTRDCALSAAGPTRKTKPRPDRRLDRTVQLPRDAIGSRRRAIRPSGRQS
jgi:hypothetical protein